MSITEFLFALGRTSAAAGVLVLLILATRRLLRGRLSPGWQSALWLLVILRLLPISPGADFSLFNLLPPWAGGARSSAPIETYSIFPTPSASTTTAQGASAALAPSSVKPVAALPSSNESFSWPVALLATWLAGALTLGGYTVVASVRFARSLDGDSPLADPLSLEIMRDCCARLRIRRAPVLIESARVRTPALHGIFRPRLLLPTGFATTFSADEMRFVFLHELAHLRRQDLALNWITTALQSLHWFNPLVWVAFARWRADRELACDAIALEAAGSHRGREYGQTMLRLLENASAASPSPALVGILENHRDLQHRLRLIVRPPVRPRSTVAVAAIALLAGAALTDAQDRPAETLPLPSVQRLTGKNIAFLVSASESMLGETAKEVEEWRSQSESRRRDAPKWQRTIRLLESLLAQLPADTRYRVIRFDASNVSEVVGHEPREAATVAQRLQDAVPRQAGSNLEGAFAFVADSAQTPAPDRIVLITDGLPTAGVGFAGSENGKESPRIQAYERATKRVPPRVPVDTILLPSPTPNPAAPGLYWELAHATKGRLSTPAKQGGEPRTHVAFVIDTSGSMRDPNHGGLWPGVIDTIEAAITTQPPISAIQIIDGDGRFILGRRGTGAAGWFPNTPELREEIRRSLRRYDQDSISNPVPGVTNAIRFLYDRNTPDMRMGIYVVGDEFTGSELAASVLQRINELNPRDANGRRPVVINAIGFPTTIRAPHSMGNTGLKFANLMQELTHEHGGAFVGLPEL